MISFFNDILWILLHGNAVDRIGVVSGIVGTAAVAIGLPYTAWQKLRKKDVASQVVDIKEHHLEGVNQIANCIGAMEHQIFK